MPFISKGRTRGFFNIKPPDSTLTKLLIKLLEERHVGRISFEGTHPRYGPVSAEIELKDGKVVGLELTVGGRTLAGSDAVPVLQSIIDEVEGFAEVIDLADWQVEVDLREYPKAAVQLGIEAFAEAPEMIYATAMNALELLVDVLQGKVYECYNIEGFVKGKDCSGNIEGKICKDDVDLTITVDGTAQRAKTYDEFRGALKSIKETGCVMVEVRSLK